MLLPTDETAPPDAAHAWAPVCPLCLPSPRAVSSFFFLFTPPPPKSTLFPYTTLFRSRQPAVPCRADGRRSERLLEDADPLRRVSGHREQARRAHFHEGIRRLGWRQAADPERRRPDRKSTRLNSSHRCISYAVFCLKKK